MDSFHFFDTFLYGLFDQRIFYAEFVVQIDISASDFGDCNMVHISKAVNDLCDLLWSFDLDDGPLIAHFRDHPCSDSTWLKILRCWTVIFSNFSFDHIDLKIL